MLVTNEVGDYDFLKQDFLERLFDDQLDENEKTQLDNLSILIDEDERWKYFSWSNEITSIIMGTTRCWVCSL